MDTRALLRFGMLSMLVGTLASGCHASFDIFGAATCDGEPPLACFDACTGNGVSPVCGESGAWECPASPLDCNEDCASDGLVDCVDACGEFVLGYCDNGVYTCPPVEGGVVCEEEEERGLADWNVYFGTAGYQGGRVVTIDDAGNVIVAGHFQQTLTSEWMSIEPVGGYDTFIAKHAPDGTPMWTYHYGFAGDELPSGIGVDQAGNIVVAIGVSATASQPSYAGPLTLLALTSDGVKAWERSYGVSAGGEQPMLAVADDGEITVVGSYSGGSIFEGPLLPTFGETDFFVARLDAAGDLLWSRSFGGQGYDYVSDVDIDGAGNVFIAGLSGAAIAFGTEIVPNDGGYDGFVASLDDQGAVRWARGIGATANDLCARVAATGDGGAAVTGQLGDAAQIGDVVLLPDSETGGAFVARLADDGSIGQVHQLPGSGAGAYMNQHQFSVAVDSEGNMVVGGQFEGSWDSVSPSEAESAHDMLLMRYAPDGSIDWGYSFGGHSSELVRDIAVGDDGQIAVVGEYWSGVDFGLGSLPSFVEGSIFLAQFAGDGAPAF